MPPQNSVQSAEKGCYANSSVTCVSTHKQPSTSIKWWIIKRYGLSPSVLAHPGSVSFNRNCNKYPNNDLNTVARRLSQPPASRQDWDLLVGMLGGLWWWAGLLSAGKTHPALWLMEAIALAKRANGKILAGAALKIWSPQSFLLPNQILCVIRYLHGCSQL